MKQKTMRFLTSLSIGLVSLGVAGFGGYWVYNSFKPSEPHINYKDYDFQQESAIGGLNIKMAPIDAKNQKYFLSESGKKGFAKAVSSFLNYGPEFYDVPTIYIDNMNGIGNEENGNYLPSGHSGMKDASNDLINLNSQSYINLGLYPVSIDEKNDPNENMKITLLMQVLFHEYGHFLANKYLQSEPRVEKQKVFSVFADTTSGKTKIINVKWNKVFMDQFEKDLNYDNIDLGNGKTAYRKPLLEGRTRDIQSGTQSIGSIYSANELWQLSNHVTKDDKRTELFDKLKVGSGTLYGTGGLTTLVKTTQDQAYNYDAKTLSKSSEKLSYLYSTDEVFTRKYQQILMPYNCAHGEGNNRISITGLIDSYQSSGRTTPYQVDTLNYMDHDTGILNNKYWLMPGYNTIDPNKPAGVYMADNPIVKKDNLYDIYAQQVGYKDEGHSDDISVIYYDNDQKIRIGGYISNSYPTNENGNYDAFRIGNKNFTSDTEVYDAHFRMPESFKSNILKPFEKGLATKFWVSKPIEPKDIGKLLGKPLSYIKNDDNGTQIQFPMKHMKESEIGLVTTWRSAYNHKHTDYHFELNENGIPILTKGSGA